MLKKYPLPPFFPNSFFPNFVGDGNTHKQEDYLEIRGHDTLCPFLLG